MERPLAGTHYPKSLGEFRAWFRTDADCLAYLEWLRWPCGFVCPSCGHLGGWRLGDGRFMCIGCGGRTSVMAGTIFDRTRTPLTVWFSVCWYFATGKDGISALSLKRTLEIGSYQTAWAVLHRLRSVLVRPDRERLRGKLEVDETYIGGKEAGLSVVRRGRRSLRVSRSRFWSRKDSGAVEWRPWRMPPRNHFTPLYWTTLSRGQRSSPMPGRVTGDWRKRGTSMTAVASVPHQRKAKIPETFCQACTD
jgi:hypothetical protein